MYLTSLPMWYQWGCHVLMRKKVCDIVWASFDAKNDNNKTCYMKLAEHVDYKSILMFHVTYFPATHPGQIKVLVHFF